MCAATVGDVQRMVGRLDLALALILFVLAQEHVWSGAAAGSRAVTAPAAAVATLAVAARSRVPLAAAAAMGAAVVLQSVFASSPQAPWLIATAVALVYSTGTIGDLRRALAGVAIVAAALGVDFAAADDRSVSGALFVVLLVALPWLAGRAFQRRDRRAELEQDAKARAAVDEERARVARELHDMVAHAVSLVVVQAEAAEAVLDTDPARTRQQLQAIQQTGRQALGEMTRLLDMLRRGDGKEPLAPQPSLAQLESLLAEVRGAGLAVDLESEGEPLPLPPGVDLTAYRIIQEALTNTRKHAAATRASVALRYETEALALSIVDDGRPVNGRPNAGGHGLVGMRERVQLYGGTLSTGRRPEGGYEVRVRLPLDAAST